MTCSPTVITPSDYCQIWLFGAEIVGRQIFLTVKLTKLHSLSVLNYTVIWNTVGSNHCQILYLWICLLATIYLGPQNQSSSHLHDHSDMSVSQSVQSLSRVRLFVTPWTAAHQASRSITDSQRLPKLMPMDSVMHSNHLILYCPFSSCLQSFPASGSFQMSQLFASGGQNTGVSASTSVLPINTQDWSPLGWTGCISL